MKWFKSQSQHLVKTDQAIQDLDSKDQSVQVIRAEDLNLMQCHCCGLLNPIQAKQQSTSSKKQRCTRCRSPLHLRKPRSLDRTFALVIAASILYIPANILPMTVTNSILGSQQDTIMSGVIFFWQSGDYFVASVIFCASVFIPMLKLAILFFLLFAVHMQASNRWHFSPATCSLLYRVVEFIGRWSMIDVFVVALLSALIQIQSLATILAGPGAVAFGAVVVLTMLASMSFDPRIIWDNYYHARASKKLSVANEQHSADAAASAMSSNSTHARH